MNKTLLKILAIVITVLMTGAWGWNNPTCDSEGVNSLVTQIIRGQSGSMAQIHRYMRHKIYMEGEGSCYLRNTCKKDYYFNNAQKWEQHIINTLTYTLEDIVVLDQNPSTGAYVCTATLVGHVPGWPTYRLQEFEYSVQKTTDGRLYVRVLH